MTEDPIIDRTPSQKRKRIEKLRLELQSMGFSIVPTEWLNSIRMDLAKLEHVRKKGEFA